MTDIVEVKIKKLRPDAVIPQHAHLTDVGYDATAIDCEYDVETDTYKYHTGIAIETKSTLLNVHVNACYGFPRSSNSKKEAYLTNSVGIIDSDGYRGEIQFHYKNRTSLEVMIELETLKRIVKNLSTNESSKPNYEKVYDIVKSEYTDRAKNLEFAPYKVGDRIGQFVFRRETNPWMDLVDHLDMETDRGQRGFGGTGQ